MSLTLRHLFAIVVLPLLFFSVVIPNSFQLLTGGFLVAAAVLALPLIRWSGTLSRAMLAGLLTVVVSLFYMLIGLHNGAPVIAMGQLVVIYVVSPFLWLLVSAGLLSSFDQKAIDRWSFRFTFLAFVSVGLFFYLYMTYGRGAVAIFKQNANVYISEGSSTATMFVYGSMIYLLGGLASAPGLVKGKWWALLLYASGFAVVVTSGRHALIFSIVLGFVFGIVLRRRSVDRSANVKKRPLFGKQRFVNLSITFIGCVLAVSILEHYGIISMQVLLDSFAEKLSSGGGAARTDQFFALLDGIKRTYGLGAGHGVGVEYIRDYVYPWRYENVWIATLYRVGVFGSLIYLVPFIYCGLLFFRLYRSRRMDDRDVYVLGGFLAAFLASATNPYIEAFCFQWMYVFPLVYVCYRWSDELTTRRDSRT